MEELKRLRAEEERRKAEEFALKVETDVLRIKTAKTTISRPACMEAAKQFYILRGYSENLWSFSLNVFEKVLCVLVSRLFHNHHIGR